jgi:hypothetical protein
MLLVMAGVAGRKGMQELERRVAALKSQIAVQGVEAVVGWRFEREVDALLDLFYDDIGTIKLLSLRSLFDLFLLKVLYIGHGGRDYAVLEYISDMLNRFLLTRELVRVNTRYDFLFTLLEEIKERQRFQNLFEASRQMADNALFVTGIFPQSQPGRRRRGMMRPPRFDRSHFIELGRRYYEVAAQEELAEVVGQREVLMKLSQGFRFYMEALNEVSQRYILGFDMEMVTNKMLDAFNLYRKTGDQAHMEAAQKYAALLKVDRSFNGLRRPRGRILDIAPGA